MKNIFEILRDKERQLQQLTREVEALRLATRLLAEDGERLSDVDKERLTQPTMIREVLKDKGKPMHVSDIIAAIQKKYRRKFKPVYLTAVLYRCMKKGKIFSRTGPNTFGLIEWPVTQPQTGDAKEVKKAG